MRSLSVLPIGRFFFLRLGFRFEQGFPLGGASLLPKVERYFAGGDTTIRGYQLDRARIEVVRYLDPSFATGDVYRVDYRPLGGNLRILQNIDLLFPISPPWYGSVFFDNGVVADSLDGLSLTAVPPRRRRLAAADPAADRRRQPGLGLAPRPRPRRHPDRRLPRQRRPAVLLGPSEGPTRRASTSASTRAARRSRRRATISRGRRRSGASFR